MKKRISLNRGNGINCVSVLKVTGFRAGLTENQWSISPMKKSVKANGSIALQIHDGGGIKVRWRNLLIEELP